MQEKLLSKAFDFQKFSGNQRLQAVIDASHARTTLQSLKLSDEDLDLVAGGRKIPEDPNHTEDN